MGFLSAWDDTERIDVSDLAGELEGTWWVEVKKCLSHGEADEVMRHLMRKTMKLGDPSPNGKVAVATSLSVDAVVDNQELIVAKSIVDWNLTDREGNVLPLEPFEALENSLSLLPSPVYDRVAGVVVPANTEKTAEVGSFSDDGGRGDEVGLDYTPNDREVLV